MVYLSDQHILTTNAQGEITKRQNSHVHCVNLFVGMQEDVLVCVLYGSVLEALITCLDK